MSSKKRTGGRRATSALSSVASGGGGVTPSSISSVKASGTPTKMTDAQAGQLRTQYDDSYDSDVRDAIKLYISDSNPNGDGYSHSQNLNYKLDNGVKLNPTESYIDANIQRGMHDIGKSTTLTRYCHDDILKQCGISNYQNMTETQLKKALVGTEFKTTSYTSYSYDTKKNPFRVGASGGGGREVTMITNTKPDTKMVFGAKKQSEIVLNKGQKQKIVDVYFDGTTATPRNSSPKKRIVIKTESV